MKPFLKIDNTTSLHLPRPELAVPLFEAIDENRAYLRKWLPWVDGTRSEADTKTFIAESMAHNSNGTKLTTLILYGEKLAGSIGAVSFNREHRRCELGYWLREDLQGAGIMTKVAHRFIEHLFTNKTMNRVEAQVLVGNQSSSALLRRLGFRREACLKQAAFMYNAFHDVEIYGLVKEDWAQGAIF